MSKVSEVPRPVLTTTKTQKAVVEDGSGAVSCHGSDGSGLPGCAHALHGFQRTRKARPHPRVKRKLGAMHGARSPRSHASHHTHAPRSPVPSPRLPADDRTFAPIRADQPGRATYWSTRDSLSRPTSMLKTASVMFLMASISVTGARLTTGKLDSSSRERERRRDRP